MEESLRGRGGLPTQQSQKFGGLQNLLDEKTLRVREGVSCLQYQKAAFRQFGEVKDGMFVGSEDGAALSQPKEERNNYCFGHKLSGLFMAGAPQVRVCITACWGGA